MEYSRGAVTEWYVNGPLGLEQGFTFERAPEGEDRGELTLSLALVGNLHARVIESGKAMALEGAAGEVALQYAGLSAQDARGQPLRAWLELAPRSLLGGESGREAWLLHVDDRGAAYPLIIDPVFQQGQLTASDGTANDAFGSSVAISGDGKIIVVGARYHQVGSQVNQGEAYVFGACAGCSSGYWQEAARLASSDGAASDTFGASVAISADENAIVVGAPGHPVGGNDQQGEAYVFVQPPCIAYGCGSSNITESAKFISSDGAAYDNLGTTVAINKDGKSVTVGAPAHQAGSNTGQGEAYVLFNGATVYLPLVFK